MIHNLLLRKETQIDQHADASTLILRAVQDFHRWQPERASGDMRKDGAAG